MANAARSAGTEQRVVIVTGAGAGIGRGIARRFAKAGDHVVIAEYNAESGRAVAAELEVLGAQTLFVPTDVSEQAQVEALVRQTIAHFGTVHVLVNNAWSSKVPLSRVEWFDEATLNDAFKIGTYGALHAMKACFPHMKRQQFGRIINLCSLNGVNAHMFSLHYNMAKEALRTLTRTAAVEWAAKGITCNAVCPAARTEAMIELEKVAADMLEQSRLAIPMQYFGDPEQDIAPVVEFLASDGARYLTGNTLFVDGGSHVNGSPWKMDLPEEYPG